MELILKLMLGFLIVYGILCLYFMITEYFKIKNNPDAYKPEMFEGEERYVFNREIFDGGIEYWDRKEKKYVIY
jgi:hypothetical protein